ncbi:MAG: septum formation protein Maf [Candidatus Marinimicrobia bacterium]|nr:septum formation protein Maf [Candidatus Neomarinimicrobiota bacterium]
MKIILASKSERRKLLLKKIGVPFIVTNSNLNEKSIKKSSEPNEYCEKLATLKANLVAKKYPDDIIIGADTIVYLKNKILEKPLNFKSASKMLQSLSDKEHSVFTGISIISFKNKINITFSEETKVKFLKITEQQIKSYITEYHPYDKSGSYGIQDGSCLFIDYIIGNYENVMGLPLSKINKILIDLKIIK